MALQIGVIGGSGFIGSALVEALLEGGHGVRIIDIARSSRWPELWTAADVRDRAALLRACEGCDVLYNLAAEHRDDVRPRELYHQVNVEGARHSCAVAVELGIERLIFTSTVAVYGLPEGEADEAAPLRPFNPYGRTKLAAEQVVRSWAEAARGRSLTIVRPTVVFGPGNRGNVYLLLRRIAKGHAAIVGNGRNHKSMAYVGNVAAFLAHVLDLGPGVRIYNYVDKPDLDMTTLVTTVAAFLDRPPPIHIPYPLALALGAGCDLLAYLTGRSLPLSVVRVRKYAAATRFSAARLAETGFLAPYSLHEGLIATLRHDFGARGAGNAAAASTFP